jgi:hypothetical protein
MISEPTPMAAQLSVLRHYLCSWGGRKTLPIWQHQHLVLLWPKQSSTARMNPSSANLCREVLTEYEITKSQSTLLHLKPFMESWVSHVSPRGPQLAGDSPSWQPAGPAG